MNTHHFCLSFFGLLLLGCSDPDRTIDSTEAAEAESAIHASTCQGALGTDATHYAASSANVARELAASFGPAFVSDGSAFIPGILRATSSTSPYAFAATLELGAWSTVSTTTWNGAAGTDLVVRVQGSPSTNLRSYRAAKAIFDAMTSVPETVESGAIVRRSPKGTVTCAKYPDHYQCALGPLGHVEQRATCPN